MSIVIWALITIYWVYDLIKEHKQIRDSGAYHRANSLIGFMITYIFRKFAKEFRYSEVSFSHLAGFQFTPSVFSTSDIILGIVPSTLNGLSRVLILDKGFDFSLMTDQEMKDALSLCKQLLLLILLITSLCYYN